MKNKKKIRLSDIVNARDLSIEELSALKGGSDWALYDGCVSYVCATQRSGAAELCAGAAWCTSGVGG